MKDYAGIPEVLKNPDRRAIQKPGRGRRVLPMWLFQTLSAALVLAALGPSFLARVRLSLMGEEHTAQVTDARIEQGRRGSRHLRVTYHFDYKGQRIQNDADVSEAEFRRIGGMEDPGSRPRAYDVVRIMALGQGTDVKSVVIDPGRPLWREGGLLIAMVVVPFFIPQLNRIVTEKKLLEKGVATTGRIYQKKITRLKKPTRDSIYSYEILYEYMVDNVRFTGSMTLSQDVYNTSDEGEAVTILYNRRRPKRSTVYEYAAYSCEPTANLMRTPYGRD